MVITPSGEAFLQRTLARRGQDFGPVSLIRGIDPRKKRKDEKRKAASQVAGYTSGRVYPGVRRMEPAGVAPHIERIRQAMTLPNSSLSANPAII